MKRYIAFLTLVLALVACNKAQPDGSQYLAAPQLETSTGTVQFDFQGGDASMTVASKAAVEASVNRDWVTVSISGQSVSISAKGNTSIETRYAVLTLKSDGKARNVQIIQFGFNSKYIWADTYEFDAKGGTLELLYFDSGVVTRTRTSGGDWFSVSSSAGVLTLTVEKNNEKTAREGSVEWTAGSETRTFTVKQAGK